MQNSNCKKVGVCQKKITINDDNINPQTGSAAEGRGSYLFSKVSGFLCRPPGVPPPQI